MFRFTQLALSLLLASLCNIASAQNPSFDIKQLADPDKVNREPVISETGLIVWTTYSQGLTEDGGGTSLYYYQNGITGNVTKAQSGASLASMRPIVHQDTILWSGTRSNLNRQTTWRLKEVLDVKRDIPYEEIPALYQAQLPVDTQPSTINMNLQPNSQLYSGPYSNATKFTGSRQPNIYSIPSNTVEQLIENNQDLRLLAANPTSVTLTNTPNTNIVFNLQTNNLARRSGGGLNEIYKWSAEEGIKLISYDGLDDFSPSIQGDLIAWQKAKYFPFGWEIMALDGQERMQLTTNFYYDMAPKISGRQIVWYGWDGTDYEIYLWDADTKKQTQITNNDYDDVSPVISDGTIAWEGYLSTEADIFFYQNGIIKQLSDSYEDDINPSISNGQVVWQGYDGDDFEIYHFNGTTSTKLTDNQYDDILPNMHDGLITWMGYTDSWDAEIYYYTQKEQKIKQLTDNDYEDRNPKTAKGRIVWQADDYEKSLIFLAEPTN